MKRDTVKAYRARAKQTDGWVAEAVATVNADRDAQFKAANDAPKAAESARVKFTRDDVLGAAIVLIKNDRWRRVVRVNRDTVTVGTGYSWTERFPFDMVIDTRAVTS